MRICGRFWRINKKFISQINDKQNPLFVPVKMLMTQHCRMQKLRHWQREILISKEKMDLDIQVSKLKLLKSKPYQSEI